MIESDELLSIRAAELYYEEDKTQDEIGSILALTRWKVGRLLAQAKASGFIRIEIVHPRARRLPVERRLRETCGLADAIVVSTSGVEDQDELQSRTAQAAADYLATLRPVPRTLGISWGRTLDDVSRHLRGRLGRAASTSCRSTAASASTAAPAPRPPPRSPSRRRPAGTPPCCPARRSSSGWRPSAPSSPTAPSPPSSTSRRAPTPTCSAPERPTRASVLVDSGYLTPDDVAGLVRRGAVGDVVGRYVDAAGAIVDERLDERTIGLPLESLRAAQLSIAVIAGAAKHAVARAVVTSGLCTVLVTDEETALHLIENHHQPRRKVSEDHA